MKKTNDSSKSKIIFFTGLIIAGLIFTARQDYFSALKNYIGFDWLKIGGYSFLGILLFICAFFVIREISTWYWKITKVVSLLEKIEENTRPKNIEKKVEAVNKGY